MKLLHIDSSITGEASVSRIISRQVVDKCLKDRPGIQVIYRDLTADPIHHMTGRV